MRSEHQRPEGLLIDTAMKAKGLSAIKAAKQAGISDARWRQIVNGYASAGAGQVNTVEAPDNTLARMAKVVDVTPEQLREAGRPEAADQLLVLTGAQAEADWQNVGSVLDRLIGVREQLNGVIAELSNLDAPGGRGGGSSGETAPMN